MTARIRSLAIAVALVALVSLGQVSTTSATTAQVFVTGYALQGYTATGTYVHPGTCAVDPRVIPLGSYVTIQGLGTCHAEDTGGAIIGYRIDVWEPTVAQAYALTGWYTASWGTSLPRQAPASPAAQPPSPVPTPKRLPQRVARAGRAAPRRWYSHGNPYVHRDPRAPARRSEAQPTYALALISFPAQGCPAIRRTTIVARVRACTLATVPALHDIQESMGLHGGVPVTHVDGSPAPARGHEARVRSGRAGAPAPGTTRVLTPA